MNKINCPNCGSENIKVVLQKESRQLTLGPEFSYEIPMSVCEICGEEGDFAGDADVFREKAITDAKKNLAAHLIEDIQKLNGLKLAYVERAFELPQRTISSKWRSGVSASGLALLRIISAMPWIVNIADNKFTESAIGYEIARVLRDKGATFESSVGSQNGMHIKITKAAENSAYTGIEDSNHFLVRTGT